MNGILLVDKPADWTSHDVVAKLRGVLGERRMGHSGTLDPMATGLLVVFAGRATRAVSFSENHSKCYEARLRLGLTTDTQDTTGTVLSRCDRRVTRAELEAALPQFRGDILQRRGSFSCWRRSRTAWPSRSKVFSRFLDVWKTRNGSLPWAFLTAFISATPRSCAARSRAPGRWAPSPRS